MKPAPIIMTAALAISLAPVGSSTPPQPATDRDLELLLDEIKPQPGESPWREIAWHSNVTEARERAIAENKPLVIFTAADGSPLGRT